MRPVSIETRRKDRLVDRWFRALDQRCICVGMRQWLLQVTAVHIEQSDVWIQIAALDADAASVVLRVDANTTVDQAITALKAHRASHNRVSQPHVIDAIAMKTGGDQVTVAMAALP